MSGFRTENMNETHSEAGKAVRTPCDILALEVLT